MNKTIELQRGWGIDPEHLNDLTLEEGLKYIDFFRPDYPTKPSTPKTPDPIMLDYLEQVKNYAIAAEKYVEEQKLYAERKKTYTEWNNDSFEIKKEFIWKEAGMNTVPEQYREKVWSFAWREGHSNGFSEVYCYLCDLVDIFE